MANTLPSIVRGVPVLLLAAACTADSPVSPAADSPQEFAVAPVIAMAKGGQGKGKGTTVTNDNHCDFDDGTDLPACPFLLEANRLRNYVYNPGDGVVYECQINGFEDGIGTTRAVHANGDTHDVVNEDEAYVLIRQIPASALSDPWGSIGLNDSRWTVTHIGRGAWDMTQWSNPELVTPSNALGLRSWNTQFTGVLVPFTDADADAWRDLGEQNGGADIRESRDDGETVFGAEGIPGQIDPTTNKQESDGLREDLGFVGLGPLAEQPSAIALVDDHLQANADQAERVDCRFNVTIYNNGNSFWIPVAGVELGGKFPGKFRTFLNRGS